MNDNMPLVSTSATTADFIKFLQQKRCFRATIAEADWKLTQPTSRQADYKTYGAIFAQRRLRGRRQGPRLRQRPSPKGLSSVASTAFSASVPTSKRNNPDHHGLAQTASSAPTTTRFDSRCGGPSASSYRRLPWAPTVGQHRGDRDYIAPLTGGHCFYDCSSTVNNGDEKGQQFIIRD